MTDRAALLACTLTGALVAMSLDAAPWDVFMSAIGGAMVAALADRTERAFGRRKE